MGPADEPSEPAPTAAGPIPPPAAPPVVERDRVAGFSIIFVAFSAALIISWKAAEAVKPNVAAPPAPPTSAGLAGYPGQVDPLASLGLAKALTERSQLRRIVATGVRADGTVDLSEPKAAIRYEFDSAQGEGPEPPRAAGTVRAGHYCGRQTVHIKKEGIYADPDQPRAPCRINAGEPLPEPRCSLQQLWATARERRAPSDGHAMIEYFRAHEGPAWRFSMPEAQVHFTVYGDCERELKGKGARPLAP